MATNISEFRDIIRLLLQDNDPDIHLYDDFQLDNAVKLKVAQGKVPGYSLEGSAVDPDLTMESDGPSYALLSYHAAKCFAVGLSSKSFNTRAFSAKTGKPIELIDDIINEIYFLENGEMAS